MRFSGLAIGLAVFVAVATILLLVAMPGPGIDRDDVDRLTGRLLLQPTRADVERLLDSGDAEQVLGWLAIDKDGAFDADVDRIARVLAAELRDPVGAEASALAAPAGGRFPLAAVEDLFASRVPAAGSDLPIDDKRIDAVGARLAQRLLSSPALVPGAELAAMAERFGKRGRPLARDRWLRRAMARTPADVGIRMQAARAWIAERRLADAKAVLDGVEPGPADATAFWALRSDLSRWLGDYGNEAQALRAEVGDGGSVEQLERLVAVELARPDMAAAAAAAKRLADRSGTTEHRRQSIDLALRGGDFAGGREQLEARIAAEPGEPSWQRLLADVLEHDLRLRDALPLRAALARGDDPADREAAETLYRRLDERVALAQLLERDLFRDLDTGPEVVQLWASLDRGDEAERVLARLFREGADPVQFFRLLPWYVDSGFRDLPAAAAAMAAKLPADRVPFAVDALAVNGFDRGPALAELARRFPDVVAVKEDRIAVVWAAADTDLAAALRLARELAHEEPVQPDALGLWLALAERADDAGEELAARIALASTTPRDLRNRRRLAELLLRNGARDEAIAELQSLIDDGDDSARGPLLRLLLASGRRESAQRLLRDCDRLSTDALIAAADELFAAGDQEAALLLYRQVLVRNPEDRQATWRAGLLLSWTGHLTEALPLLETSWLAGGGDRVAVAFHLAEARHAAGRTTAARALWEFVVANADRAATENAALAMTARAMHRLGDLAGARAIYERLVAAAPRDLELLLDVAELCVDQDDDDRESELLAAARELDPASRRVQRALAHRSLRHGDYTAARDLLLDLLRRGEFTAGEYAELALAYEWAGDFGAAQATYQRWALLRNDRDARAGEQRVGDPLMVHVGAQGAWREIGDDTARDAGVYTAFVLDERTRIQARIGQGEWSGRSQAVGGGLVDVDSDTPLVDLGIVRRHGVQRDQFGFGVRWHPDVVGDRDFGGWVEEHLQSAEPDWTVSLRAGVDELWTDPAAAPGLGGRTTGVELQAFRSLSTTDWIGGDVSWRRISARAPSQPRLRDDEVVVDLQIGRRWTGGDIRTSDPFRVHRAPAGPECPWLGDGAESTDTLHASTWLGATFDHVLGDAAVTTILPIAERVHFVYVAGRLDHRLTSGLGASLDALVGTDLEASGASWEVGGSLAWRPSPTFEWNGRLGAGDAFGRPGFDSQVRFARLEGVLRF